MARSTRLVILIKNIHTLFGNASFYLLNTFLGRKRFLLPVTYFVGNASFCLLHTFTLRVTGIMSYLPFARRKRFLLPVTNFPVTYFLVYPFTLRVTGILITGRRKPFRPIKTRYVSQGITHSYLKKVYLFSRSYNTFFLIIN